MKPICLQLSLYCLHFRKKKGRDKINAEYIRENGVCAGGMKLLSRKI